MKENMINFYKKCFKNNITSDDIKYLESIPEEEYTGIINYTYLTKIRGSLKPIVLELIHKQRLVEFARISKSKMAEIFESDNRILERRGDFVKDLNEKYSPEVYGRKY